MSEPIAILATWFMPSVSGTKNYRINLEATGRLVCDCLGWRFVKPMKNRSCRHTLHIAETWFNSVVAQSDGQYVALVKDGYTLPTPPEDGEVRFTPTFTIE
jgi:hypothetical protein